MIRIFNEKELLDSFRPLDRDQVELPKDLKFPLGIQDYLAWVEPSGARVYLVLAEPENRHPLGVVFRRDQTSGPAAMMCEWCHSVRAGDGVTLLTATASSHKRVGIPLCRDLSCKDKALLRVADAPGPHDFPETLNGPEKVRRIVARMSSFARRNLF